MYILSILKDRPMNAKDIIENLLINSGGTWKPSPKIVYHLLAKLVEEDLLYQTEQGQYALTKKGVRVANDAGKVSKTLKNQANQIVKLGTSGGNKFVSYMKKRLRF